MKSIHEYIDQYEKDLDAYCASERAKLTEIRKVLGVSVPPPRGPVLQSAGKSPTVVTEVSYRNKTAEIIGLLKRPGGVTLEELASFTGWKIDSVRGFISGTLRKKKGLKIQSTKDNKTRRYVIAA